VANIATHIILGIQAATAIFAAIMTCDALPAAILAVLKHDA
jgi:hypothetical protein